MANMEKNLKNNEIKKYKMTEREIFKKYDNLSENELNTKSNKDVYVRTDIIGSAIVHSTGEKGKKSKKNRWIQKKKSKIPESEILQCPEYTIKSKIGKIFVNEKILEEYCVNIYENALYFYQHYKEKIRVEKNGHKYILFRTDVNFLSIIWL